MSSTISLTLLVLTAVVGLSVGLDQSWVPHFPGSYGVPHFTANRSAIVQLFEWRWDDIAEECEKFLGPFGYAAVQISPPTEHLILDRPPYSESVRRPWFERYQPVSYRLVSRSGSEQQLRDMVARCNAVGVRVFADVVLDHMTHHVSDNKGGQSVGIGGSVYSSAEKSFPAVPYSAANFITRVKCPTESGAIENYGNVEQLRNCETHGLLKLDLGQDYVRDKVAGMLNSLLEIGITGFRVDSARHMWPADLVAILDRVHNLTTKFGFPDGSRPFVYFDVDQRESNDVIKNSDYTALGGRALEHRYAYKLAQVFRRRESQLLRYLVNFGEGWGFDRSNYSVAFVSDPNSQRNEFTDPGTARVVSFDEPRLTKMASAFMLAWPYGIPRVMSSYSWPRAVHNWQDANAWYGPPHDEATYETSHVVRNADLSCSGGWVCEHRWRQIFNMVGFRNVVGENEPVTNWWDNGFQAIAFGRGSRGFVVFNNEYFPLRQRLQTGMPAGEYCDVMTGNVFPATGTCSGSVIRVGEDGFADFSVDNALEAPMVAIHVGQRQGMKGRVQEDKQQQPAAVELSTTPVMSKMDEDEVVVSTTPRMVPSTVTQEVPSTTRRMVSPTTRVPIVKPTTINSRPVSPKFSGPASTPRPMRRPSSAEDEDE